MIKKLRVRFVAASMLSLLLVLSVILGGLNIFNYRSIVSDIDSVLALLRESGGALPEALGDFDWREAGPRYQSPELPYEIRFFSALLNGEGDVLSTETEYIFAVDEENVNAYAQKAWQSGNASGFVDNYRYLLYAEGENSRVIFLDCGRMLAGFQDLLLNSILIALAGYAAVFVLVTLLSGRIVKPFARGYEQQRRFITDAGHEIRTPLTIIDADAELLAMELGENEWLNDIHAQTRRLSALTGDLIALSRMEEKQNLPMIEFPLSDIVRETAESFQAPARRQGKRLEIRVREGISYCGNEKGVSQLVGVLLDNAVKYSCPESTIVLTLDRQGRGVRLRVENAVECMAREDLENMFERFYRADASRSSASGGYGIGLSIARAVAEAHRGRIHAALHGGHTLVITVNLP